MKTEIECIPCILRQTVDTAKLATNDKQLQLRTVKAVLEKLTEIDFNDPPPIVGRDVYGLISQITGNPDPYKAIKSEYNCKAMQLYPGISALLRESDNPVPLAARIAAAGNIIDFGVSNTSFNLDDFVEKIHALYFTIDHSEQFLAELPGVRKILYLADNSGEIVFDRIFIETLMATSENAPFDITLAVRGAPVINDVTYHDAEEVGLNKIVKVISNGDNVPGTDLKKVSGEFLAAFKQADLIISKGMGNFETLDTAPRPIYHLLKAKCIFTANILGVGIGSLVFYKQNSSIKK